MSRTLEQLWVSLRDSDRCRYFVKRGWASVFFRSDTYQTIDTARRHWLTYHASRRHPTMFQDLQTFCLLIGHVKSGGTMIGSLLDAHPDIVFADEADVLRFVSADFTRDQICHLLVKASRREAMKGRVTARRLDAYSFLVPNQWQGRYRKLRVIGDSRAGPTTRQLVENPQLLGRLQKMMSGVRVRPIHVIRNPFDPISAMMVRGKRTFDNAIDHYFHRCNTLAEIRDRLGDANLLTMRYEELICQPAMHLRRLCRFLGTDADDDYVQACCKILHRVPDQCRHRVPWNSRWMDTVQRQINEIDFLAGYSFEN